MESQKQSEHSPETPDFDVVAAIDFGTCFSGYAFSFSSRPEDVTLNKPWGGEISTSNDKAPTAILTNGTKFEAFGYEAIQKYEEKSKTISDDFYLYTNFKMQLYNLQRGSLQRGIKVKSTDGKREMPILDLIAMLLEYLYRAIKKELKKHNSSAIADSKIRVVVTVPAIWSEDAKAVMKSAAVKAGIEETQLKLALEPVAASYEGRRYLPYHSNFAVNDLYMVVDCGGGTVDIAMHKKLSDDQVQELLEPAGGPWGGTAVDEKFVEAFSKLMGKDLIESYEKNEVIGWVNLMDHFAALKRKAKSDDNAAQSLKILDNFVAYFNSKSWWHTVTSWVDKKGGAYSYMKGNLFISADEFKGFFSEATNNIIAKIRSLLKETIIYNTKYILMVGGFSESDLLFYTIKEIFEVNGLQVIQVPRARVAVLRGAVLFGHLPNVVLELDRN